MPSDDPPQKLPVAPNMSAILNRISLGLAKHERILKTLKRAPPPSTASPAPNATSSGFSSLAGATAPTTTRSSSTGAVVVSREEEERQFEKERNLPPNAGIGFVPDEKTAAGLEQGRLDEKLRGRLGVKRRMEGGVEAGKRGGSESEEEEGRSGLGKKKRRVVRRAEEVEGKSDGAGGEGEEVGSGAGDKAAGGDVTGAEKVRPEDVALAKAEQARTTEEVQLGVRKSAELKPVRDAADGAPLGNGHVKAQDVDEDVADAAEKKRRRKQAKRKRSKANKAQATTAPGTSV